VDETPQLFASLLEPHHQTDTFKSSNDELTTWLQRSALLAQAKGTGRTYVWTDDANRVVAYFTVSPTMLHREILPKNAGHGEPETLPAYLIGRLALDESLAGKGLGGDLLRSALEVTCNASQLAGGRYILVDAIDDNAAGFYKHHGFKAEVGGGRRLFFKVSQAIESLGQAMKREQAARSGTQQATASRPRAVEREDHGTLTA